MTEHKEVVKAQRTGPSQAEAAFDPSKHLRKLQGKEYLDVKWRLAWLRSEHSDAVIETDLVQHDSGFALFKARVTIPGGGSATGYGSETKQDFADYSEKSETKALGRALAALGYGTQFCEDFETGEKVVDNPVERTQRAVARPEPPTNPAPKKDNQGGPITEQQLKALNAMRTNKPDAAQQLLNEIRGPDGSLEQLTQGQASEMIKALGKA